MLTVEQPGLRTTVQDLGRPGYAHLGVPVSGAADRFSARLANALVGNPPTAAVLETTLAGPALAFADAGVVAVTGAPAPVWVDDEPAPFGSSFAVPAGAVLRVGRASDGLRSYLAVAGGIDVPAVLGSRATDTLSGLGGAVLARGDVLPVGPLASVRVGRRVPASVLSSVLPDSGRALRVVWGPAHEWFDDAARDCLQEAEFAVAPASDRVGVRLSGPPVPRRRLDEVPTEGAVTGALQVPPDGGPIALLADHAVTGGYPVLAVLASADVPLLAQSRPGTRLRFAAVSVAEARAALCAAEDLLRLPD